MGEEHISYAQCLQGLVIRLAHEACSPAHESLQGKEVLRLHITSGRPSIPWLANMLQDWRWALKKPWESAYSDSAKIIRASSS